MSPKPLIPSIFFGLFVRTRIVVRPRSARICDPIPYSRASAGKPSSRFASTVSSPCSCSSYARSLLSRPIPRPSWREVEDHATALLLDPQHGRLELLAAVAAAGVEDVTGEALGVHAHEHVLGAVHLALHQRDVCLVRDRLAVRDGLELAVLGRQPHRHDALDELLGAATVLDQVGDGDHAQAVLLAVRRSGRARGPSSRPRSSPRRPRRPAPDPRAGRGRRRPRSGPTRCSTPPGRARSGKTWPGCTRSRGAAARVDRHLDRVRPVVRRDPGGHAVARLDRDREGRAERRLVLFASSAASSSSSHRSGVRQRQISPRAFVAMKLTASGVTNCAAMVRSPSFSRSSSSTTTTNFPDADVLDRLGDPGEHRAPCHRRGHGRMVAVSRCFDTGGHRYEAALDDRYDGRLRHGSPMIARCDRLRLDTAGRGECRRIVSAHRAQKRRQATR